MADAPIFIDPKLCKGCGKCVKGCGFGALKMVARDEGSGAPEPRPKARVVQIAEVDASACKACGACVKACPFKAIREVRQVAAHIPIESTIVPSTSKIAPRMSIASLPRRAPRRGHVCRKCD